MFVCVVEFLYQLNSSTVKDFAYQIFKPKILTDVLKITDIDLHKVDFYWTQLLSYIYFPYDLWKLSELFSKSYRDIRPYEFQFGIECYKITIVLNYLAIISILTCESISFSFREAIHITKQNLLCLQIISTIY